MDFWVIWVIDIKLGLEVFQWISANVRIFDEEREKIFIWMICQLRNNIY
jgi:hypothetical protein